MKKSDKRNRKSFLYYAQDEIEQLKTNGHYGVAKNRHSAFTCLQSYLADIGKKDISFKKLNVQFICGFEHWLLHQKGVCRNMLTQYNRHLHLLGQFLGDTHLLCQPPFVAHGGIDRANSNLLNTVFDVKGKKKREMITD